MQRACLSSLASVLIASLFMIPPGIAAAPLEHRGFGADTVVIALTSIFPDGQSDLLRDWEDYLEDRLGRPVAIVPRDSNARTVEALLRNEIDFAWLNSLAYARHRDRLRIVATPLYHGRPLSRSYLIVAADNTSLERLSDLRGGIFAFTDTNSYSGHHYVTERLTNLGAHPTDFFGKTFFAWSHHKVIEAVASGLATGGAVDGYVWERLRQTQPDLIARTRIFDRSDDFPFPPIVAAPGIGNSLFLALQQTLLGMSDDEDGQRLLERFDFDRFDMISPEHYDRLVRTARKTGRR